MVEIWLDVVFVLGSIVCAILVIWLLAAPMSLTELSDRLGTNAICRELDCQPGDLLEFHSNDVDAD